MQASLPRVPETDVASFVGAAALGRARRYVDATRIRELRYDAATHRLDADVAGSGGRGGRAWYSTTVHLTAPDADGYSRPRRSLCTCPVALNCKHAAAVMLYAATLADRDAGVPDWRRQAEEALRTVDAGRAYQEAPIVGLQLSVVPDELAPDGGAGGLQPGLGNRLKARIVVPGSGGRWKSAGVEWDRLRYGWDGGLSLAQAAWLRAVDALARSHRQARVWLDLCDAEVPALWPLIVTAAEAEMEIVPGDGLREVVPGPPRRVGLTAWSPDGSALVVVAAAEVEPGPDGTAGGGYGAGDGEGDDGEGDDDDEGRDRPLPGALVGEHGDMVALVRDRVLELSPVGRLGPGVAGQLRQWRALTVPDEAVPEFCADFLPDLVDRFPVTDRVGRLELPRFDRVELELTIRPPAGAGPGGATHELGLMLQWHRVDVMRMSDDTEVTRRRPLSVAEMGIGTPLPGDPALIVLTTAVSDAGWGWILGEGTLRVTGREAGLVLTDGLEQLRALDGVHVVLADEVPSIRRATEGPRIHVATEDDRSGIDWLGLTVTVTVEGRPVPFAAIFRAVVTGQDEFLTEDGLLVPVDLERFGELRELLDEAMAASAERVGREPDGAGVKIGLGQAGVLADLAELADDLEPPSGRARALLELAADTPAPVPAPAALEADLRPYQQQGLDWLAMLWRHRIGGILADDMGLGKTIQSLALIAHAHETAGDRPPGPFLVVAPSSVVPNWEAEARRFVPSLRVSRRSATEARSTTTVAEDAAASDIVVTSAAVLRLDAESYAGVEWAGVILDEAQQAKNPGSKLFAALAGLRADFLLAVTGTPMENNLTELWAVAALSCRGVLPDAKDFRTRFRTPIEKDGDRATLERLRRRLRPFLLRRRKELVAADLPPRTDAVMEIELSATHRRIYERELARQRASLLALLDDFESNRISVLAGLTVLRRLCLDASLVDPDHLGVASAKTDELIAALREVVAEGHRALVFSQFTTYLDTVVDRLRDEGITVAHLDGSTTDRAGAVGEFTEGGAQVFCLSLKAGGVGLNLVGADYVFLLDPWWNPATEAQAVDRAHRIGQTRPVLVYRMVARDTIEERVVELQQRKAELFASVLDSGEHFSAALTADDLRGLLG
ncbi:DEAD/DEAH box helicase [Dietzia cinnamea]|uniref:DEAD/DEAH box helicase n=1 Tax=Dietzia cinnamea TaxID=321318 RepID=UPI00223B275B|nr:DEAD/DEAH box helicase [Dietzia cinnamea]MCT1886838.1 DEAD/DEAH box helicase [Dietzia cinnamea]MCT2139036.1 DEAD/DEAH box helicase [Dietzia cinnamea]MCT2263477.1 DEAD/DEAH box helicase [Dietzia cinnamea]